MEKKQRGPAMEKEQRGSYAEGAKGASNGEGAKGARCEEGAELCWKVFLCSFSLLNYKNVLSFKNVI